MQILCGYAKDGLRPETAEALAEHAPGASVIDFGDDFYAYWHAIKERWRSGEDLLIIEQDMLFTGDMIASMESCEKPWCSYGYTAAPHHGRVSACLGFTRYSASLQAQIDLRDINRGKDIIWAEIDVHMAVLLEHRRFRPHDHGDVIHLHDYDPFYMAGSHIAEADGGEFRSNEFMYFVPPSLCGLGNKALLEIPSGLLKDAVDSIIAGKLGDTQNG